MHPVETAQHRGFAASRGADNRRDRSRLDCRIDRLDRLDSAVERLQALQEDLLLCCCGVHMLDCRVPIWEDSSARGAYFSRLLVAQRTSRLTLSTSVVRTSAVPQAKVFWAGKGVSVYL